MAAVKAFLKGDLKDAGAQPEGWGRRLRSNLWELLYHELR
jgi:hypothetical protein